MKFFSFKSSSSSTGTNSVIPTQSTDKRVHWQPSLQRDLNDKGGDKSSNTSQSPNRLLSKSKKQIADNQSSSGSPGLRRSLSFSSAAVVGGNLEQENISCSSNQSWSFSDSPSGGQHQQPSKPLRYAI